jgi:hypothetical protein
VRAGGLTGGSREDRRSGLGSTARRSVPSMRKSRDSTGCSALRCACRQSSVPEVARGREPRLRVSASGGCE